MFKSGKIAQRFAQSVKHTKIKFNSKFGYKQWGNVTNSELLSLINKPENILAVPNCFYSSKARTLDNLFPKQEEFCNRHIGPNDDEIKSMLTLLRLKVNLLVN